MDGVGLGELGERGVQGPGGGECVSASKLIVHDVHSGVRTHGERLAQSFVGLGRAHGESHDAEAGVRIVFTQAKGLLDGEFVDLVDDVVHVAVNPVTLPQCLRRPGIRYVFDQRHDGWHVSCPFPSCVCYES